MSGLIDGANRSVGWQGRLENLRSWREAWKRLQWTEKSATLLDKKEPFMLKAFGLTYCELNGNKMTFSQPPSTLRGLPAIKWTIDIVGITTPVDFAYDRENQLLAITDYE